MRRALKWVILSGLFLQACHGTSIVWVVSEKGDYVVLAADSREFDDLTQKPNSDACKVISFDDTVFFASGRPRIPVDGAVPWDSIQTAGGIYKTSEDRDTQSLSIAWGKRAMVWFGGQKPSFVKSLTGADGVLVQGGFINFVPNKSPIVFSQDLVFTDGSPLSPAQLSLNPTSESMGQVGAAGIHNRELVGEFINAETSRASKAYGKLKPHKFGKELSYDKEFVRLAVQFVIDNMNDKDKPLVHGPIDVVVVRRGGIEWVTRKPNCYAQDFHSPKKQSAKKPPAKTMK